MPRSRQTKKDVVSCDNPGVEANTRRSPGLRMGQPECLDDIHPACEHITGGGYTLGSEPSKYQQEKKSSEIPPVAASERGGAQTRGGDIAGVVGPVTHKSQNATLGERSGKGGETG